MNMNDYVRNVGCATLSAGYGPFKGTYPESYEGKEKTIIYIYIYH